jgi:NAD-dependent SIR2 family protein deacetylase
MPESGAAAAAGIARAAELLAQADGLIVTAGAGMGVDSGLPDFRGTDGFWRAYPALRQAGLAFEEVASPLTFVHEPRLAWGFYGHRLALYRRTVPHAGFETLQRWGQRLKHGAWVFTSNVDGQFQKAGFAPRRVAECHGSIHWLQCTTCEALPWPADALAVEVDETRCRWLGALPTCPHCGALARPNILMFGDGAWREERTQAQLTALHHALAGMHAPLVLELGAGSAIPSVRHFGHRVLLAHGGRLVRINPRESAVPTALDVGLPLGAAAALAALDAALLS